MGFGPFVILFMSVIASEYSCFDNCFESGFLAPLHFKITPQHISTNVNNFWYKE